MDGDDAGPINIGNPEERSMNALAEDRAIDRWRAHGPQA